MRLKRRFLAKNSIKISVASIIALAFLLIPFIPEKENLAIETIVPVVAESIPQVPVILKKISWCESQNKQFEEDGSIHRGEINPKDLGKYQINERWNGEEAIRLGFDLYTLEGNTKMALYLYHDQGTTPWNWSKHCWGDPDRTWYEKGGEYWSK